MWKGQMLIWYSLEKYWLEIYNTDCSSKNVDDNSIVTR